MNRYDQLVKQIDLLDKAVEVLEVYGWTQGGAGNENCGFCASGALRYVSASKVEEHHSDITPVCKDTMSEVSRDIQEIHSLSGMSDEGIVVEWNDCGCHSAQDVITMFEKTRARLNNEI